MAVPALDVVICQYLVDSNRPKIAARFCKVAGVSDAALNQRPAVDLIQIFNDHQSRQSIVLPTESKKRKHEAIKSTGSAVSKKSKVLVNGDDSVSSAAAIAIDSKHVAAPVSHKSTKKAAETSSSSDSGSDSDENKKTADQSKPKHAATGAKATTKGRSPDLKPTKTKETNPAPVTDMPVVARRAVENSDDVGDETMDDVVPANNKKKAPKAKIASAAPAGAAETGMELEEDSGSKPLPKTSSGSKKANTPFKRVSVESVYNLPFSMRDNSFEANRGEDDWGVKANSKLKLVKGKGFRQEKTKKKKGTYRGGQMDLTPQSIKFDDDDDE